jgi:hypothetical protein
VSEESAKWRTQLVVLLYQANFLVTSSLFVVSWGWTAAPMFHVSAAPFTAGLEVTLLIFVIVGVVEPLKDYM